SGLGVLISIPGALGYIYAGWPKMDVLPPLSLGYVSFIGFLLFIPTSIWTAPIGARLAHRLSKRRLEVAFGLFLLVVASRFVVSLLS
ncbi:MAG: TSUP family transporter, partial [Bosea sp. (in: a-proteobacteria)]